MIQFRSVRLSRTLLPLLFFIVLTQVPFLFVVQHVPVPSINYQAESMRNPFDVSDHNNPDNSNRQQQERQQYDVTSKKQQSRFAYAFLIAGCNPSKPSYRGFLYNVLVSNHMLRLEGSKADVVLLLRMKNETHTPTLPANDERLLRDSGIRFMYLPPPTTGESFYSAMMAKFYILNLTDYSRVLYLDADVMPLCNMDYVFELSEQGILKENLVVAWWGEPALGAVFMLQPGIGEYQRLQDVVAVQQAKTANSWPPFDEVEGWGHKIELPDEWFAFKNQHGTRWNFQFAFADQGLLYHWVKYVKKSVSIVFSRRIFNYAASPNGTVFLQQTLLDPLENVTCPRFVWDVKSKRGGITNTLPFYHDYKHFSGKAKPWEKDNVETGIPEDVANRKNATSARQLWFHILRQVRNHLNVSLDVEQLSFGRPSLGRGPTFYHMAQFLGRNMT